MSGPVVCCGEGLLRHTGASLLGGGHSHQPRPYGCNRFLGNSEGRYEQLSVG